MVNAISGGLGVGNAGAASEGDGFAYLSPETMLMYCQNQLQSLDGEVKMHMEGQQKALRQRQAIQHAQRAVDSFGTAGPQNAAQYEQCVKAIDQAIAQLPPGDPVAAQLLDFKNQTSAQYGYNPAAGLTAEERARLDRANQVLAERGITGPVLIAGGLDAESAIVAQAQVEKQILETKSAATFTPPDKAANQWQGNMDSLKGISDSVKAASEIDMMILHDLAAKRQTCVTAGTQTIQKLHEAQLTICKNI